MTNVSSCYVLTLTERETNNTDVLGVYDSWVAARAMVLAWIFEDTPDDTSVLKDKELEAEYDVYETDKLIYKIEEMEMKTPMY